MSNRNLIRVFEHQSIRLGDFVDDKIKFEIRHLNQFKNYHKKEIERRKKGSDKAVYFSLISDGIQFKQYVGVIKIGSLVIEVLPKVDKLIIKDDDNENKLIWQTFLYKMFKYAADVKGNITSYAPLKHQSNNFLDLYLSYFLAEVDYLFKTGLIKKYHKVEANLNSLKGSLLFQKQFSKNSIHQERFFCEYSKYDTNNLFNQILYKALVHVKRINSSPKLISKIEGLIINFPEMKNIEVSEAFFEKIVFDRKSSSYKTAINLAKFILLNLHPDLNNGQSDTLAIMFDMNRLWEVYVYKKLKEKLKGNNELKVLPQNEIGFWKKSKVKSRTRVVKADIVVQRNDVNCAVFDTKWKIDSGYVFPDEDNLKQMFVYNQLYFKNSKEKRSALIYPSKEAKETEIGNYINNSGSNFGECSLVYAPLKYTEAEGLEIDLDNLLKYITNKRIIERVTLQNNTYELSVGYIEESKLLEIEYEGGEIRQYTDVPKKLYERILSSYQTLDFEAELKDYEFESIN